MFLRLGHLGFSSHSGIEFLRRDKTLLPGFHENKQSVFFAAQIFVLNVYVWSFPGIEKKDSGVKFW